MAICSTATAQAPGSTGIDLQVGGVVGFAPRYEGSKDYRAVGFPIIAPSGLGNTDSGLIQFRGIDDLRFRVLKAEGFEAGPLVGWRFGREQDASLRLRGLGDVDGGLVVGGYAGYRFGAIMPFVSYHNQVTGDTTGGVVRFGAEARTDLSPGMTVTATAGASYADADYANTFFSVTRAQSATSLARLTAYDADAGIKDVYLGLSGSVPLSKDWSLKLNGRYARLVGDAKDSPIVESANQFSGGIGLTYQFNLPR